MTNEWRVSQAIGCRKGDVGALFHPLHTTVTFVNGMRMGQVDCVRQCG